MGDSPWWPNWRSRDETERMLRTVLKNQERMMAQIDDLNAALAAIGPKVDALATEVQDLITKLQAPTPDLSGAIASAQMILSKLQAIPPEPTA